MVGRLGWTQVQRLISLQVLSLTVARQDDDSGGSRRIKCSWALRGRCDKEAAEGEGKGRASMVVMSAVADRLGHDDRVV